MHPKHWNIQTKLFVSQGSILLLALIQSISMGILMGQFVETTSNLAISRQLEGVISRVVQIDSSFTAVVELLINDRDQHVLPYYDERLIQYRAALATLDGVDIPVIEQQLLNNILSTRDELFALEERMLDSGKKRDFATGLTLLTSERYLALKQSLLTLAGDQTKAIMIATADHEKKRAALQLYLWWMSYGFLLFVLASGGTLIYVISSHISRTAREIEAAATAIGGGETGRRIVVQSQDEIGRTAIAFNKMAVALDEARMGKRLGEITREIEH